MESVPVAVGPKHRPRMPVAALLLLLLAVGILATWAVVARPRPTPDLVRARLREDLLAGRTDRCDDALAWLARHDRLTTPELMASARVAQLRGRPAEALASLARIDRGDPLAPHALVMAGLIELARDRARPAEAALRAALELDPGLLDPRRELLRIYSRQQRPADLDEQFTALSERNAIDFEHLSFWALTRNTTWNPAQDIEILGRWVEADPEDRASRLALAEGMRRLSRGDQAEAILAPLDGSDPEIQALWAELAVDRGDLNEASRILTAGSSSHAGLSRMRGLIALSRGDAPGATRELLAAFRVEPDDRLTVASLATALKMAGDPQAARPFLDGLRRYAALDALVERLAVPDLIDGELLRRIGSACEALDRRSEARAWYQLAIARNPLDAEAQKALFRLVRVSNGGAPAGVVDPGAGSKRAD
jgi:predicted Zn-dependent protease